MCAPPLFFDVFNALPTGHRDVDALPTGHRDVDSLHQIPQWLHRIEEGVGAGAGRD